MDQQTAYKFPTICKATYFLFQKQPHQRTKGSLCTERRSVSQHDSVSNMVLHPGKHLSRSMKVAKERLFVINLNLHAE